MKIKQCDYLTTVTSEYFILDGIDVFSPKAIDINEQRNVRDPLYGKKYNADIYLIDGILSKHYVAIAEFSNNVFGIYELTINN